MRLNERSEGEKETDRHTYRDTQRLRQIGYKADTCTYRDKQTETDRQRRISQ